MNTKLVESLAQIIQSLSLEEQTLLEEKIKLKKNVQEDNFNSSVETQERPFYETATPEEWVKAFREWAESHPLNTPLLSDEAISRESIYGERG